jgi:hypothetical protein
MVGLSRRLFRASRSHVASILTAALCASACGSTSTESVTGPSAPKCAVSLGAAPGSIDAGGGAAAITVTTQPECAWTATAEAAWITELAPTQGQGTAELQFRVIANPNGTARESAIAVNGQRAVIRQAAAACQFAVAASNAHFSAAAGTGSVTVSGPAGCGWTASSTVSWIALSPVSGAGSGTVGFTVALNTGAARTGTITVGGETVTITQDAGGSSAPPPPPPAPCTVSLQPTSTSIPAAGGSGSVTITASCPWSASSSVPWITLTTPASGSGNGSVGFLVAANSSSTGRIGSLNIGGATFTVDQAGSSGSSCTVSINPTSQSVGAAATNGVNVAVTTGSGCTWTATSNASWLTIAAGGSGSGNGTVTLNVSANTGGTRTGTVIIGGQTFTVTQAQAAAACSYSINPTSITVGDREVSGLTVAVSAPAGCSWTATENAGWLNITSGKSGSGSGTVTYRTSNFNGNSRVGTLTIGGQTFTVTQVQCTATLNPQTQAVPALGGSFTVAVTTQLGCPWSVQENLNWVTITSATSGTGSGTVSYAVLPNTGGARSGNVAIAGQTLTVNQAAVLP